VKADFVTLDLNSHTITGDGAGIGVTDLQQERQGIVVHNGTITNFDISQEGTAVCERRCRRIAAAPETGEDVKQRQRLRRCIAS
jgi:hypothetical protein